MNAFNVDDLKGAEFSRTGENVTIKLSLKDQTDGLEGSKYSGSIGRGIGVVGNVPQLLEENKSSIPFKIDISNTTGSLAYSEAAIKVVADKDGKLVQDSCSWSYKAVVEAKKVKIELFNINGGGTVNYMLAY